MAKFEIFMPKMGESITEATIIKWHKKAGDTIKEDEAVADIATDKVDSEIPSPVEGKIVKLLYKEGDVVEVGKVIVVIATDGDNISEEYESKDISVKEDTSVKEVMPTAHKENVDKGIDHRFYSPLVKNIAKQEQISPFELASINGTGKDGRLTKEDLLQFLQKRTTKTEKRTEEVNAVSSPKPVSISASGGDTIIEMDRMRQLIANHMIGSVQTSAHVTSFAEADMSNVVRFREEKKSEFLKNDNEKLTFTHIIIHAVARALKDYPMVNASVNGKQIILRKNINIGLATALSTGNLIVPVIKNADEKSLLGIVKNVNDLAQRARDNKLMPDEIQGGTFTITNLGTFNSLTGTPIINQPQVAILSMGVIKKRPVVLETAEGDVIAIRHMMYLSLTYDHRIVDGALGGMFLDKVVKYLENYTTSF
ncbi:MAG: dihydrolipoamide acetyltransferase family protein [Bacteroidales bacterium]|nr:dihydrolipoamide acetyltransferase family protein [Bacteroidales bacterium]